MRLRRIYPIVAACLVVSGAASAADMDPVNPSCPKQLNWSTYPRMKFTLDTSSGHRILKAEGTIDEDVASSIDDAHATLADASFEAIASGDDFAERRVIGTLRFLHLPNVLRHLIYRKFALD